MVRNIFLSSPMPSVLFIFFALKALAVDMTARNLQDRVKKQGLPWSTAKGFDTFTPIGYVSLAYPGTSSFLTMHRSFLPKSAIANPHDLNISLKVSHPNTLYNIFELICCSSSTQVNGAIRQNGKTADMIFRIPRLIEHISSIMTLEVRNPTFT